MTPDLLLEHFDRLADAPDAIPHLRRFILDLAVRGKLVEQYPSDEPASALLRRIEAGKARVGKQEKLLGQNPVPQFEDETLPFQTPSQWSWAYLAALSRRIHYGFTASANTSLRDVRLVRITDIQNNIVDWSSVPGCEISKAEIDQYRLEPGDILIARTGGTIGKTFLVTEIPITAVFASYLIRVQLSAELDTRYLKLFLESPLYWTQLQEVARGTGQPNVNGQTLGSLTVPVPPHAEQHRIVARVDELMALCDQLEAAQAERESRRDRLVAASLHRLSDAAGDGEDLQESARFCLNRLPNLVTRPEQVTRLRHAILSLAVRGKLVPQDPNDEPTTELLRRIRTQFATGLRGTPAKGPERSKSAIGGGLFCIPSSWIWIALGEITSEFRYGTAVKCSYEQVGEPVLRIPNVRNGRIDIKDLKYGPLSARDAAALKLRLGDILMVRSNGSLDLVGRPAVVEASAVGMSYAGYLVRLRTSPDHLDARYIVLVLNSRHVREQIEGPIRTTVGLKNVNAKEMSALMIPLPPLGEQRRIVAKVDELMATCDQLEAQLVGTQEQSRRFLEAVLHDALASASTETHSELSAVSR